MKGFSRSALPTPPYICRCPPSHSNLDHDDKGCHHPVTKFYWNRARQEFDIVNVPCQCKSTPVAVKVEHTILEDEKDVQA